MSKYIACDQCQVSSELSATLGNIEIIYNGPKYCMTDNHILYFGNIIINGNWTLSPYTGTFAVTILGTSGTTKSSDLSLSAILEGDSGEAIIIAQDTQGNPYTGDPDTIKISSAGQTKVKSN